MSSSHLQHVANGGLPFSGVAALAMLWLSAGGTSAETPSPLPAPPAPDFGDNSLAGADAPSTESEPEFRFYVKQIRVSGSKLLTNPEIETVIYPFLGPGKTLESLEEARAALEKAYRDKGYQTVTVELPQQNGTRGVIYMNVVEGRIGRLTVKGSRYFLPSEIKRAAPSLAEGTVPNFNQVTKDLVALNAWPERQVTPSIRPGVVPGTFDVDLEVKDKSPLHGSVELNNRFVTNTTELRLDTSVRYANLWQKGHAFGLSAQIAPQNTDDSMVISGFYLARFPQLSKFSLQLMASKQDSLIGTLGGVASIGAGATMGLRGIVQLPTRGSYFHSVSAGFDYKAFDPEPVTLGGFRLQDLSEEAKNFLKPELNAPLLCYYPISVAYSGGLTKKNSFTEFNAALQFHLRGLGSDIFTFDRTRYRNDGSWTSLRTDIAHTQDLPKGFQVFGKFQTQLTNDSLVPNEQFVIGGVSTIRGYPEASVLGDTGWVFNFEVRSPSLIQANGQSEGGTPDSEFRLRTFFDAGTVYVNEVLPEQTETFELASFGFGATIDLAKNFHGNLDLAWPLTTQGITPNTPAGSPHQHDPFLSFQVGYDF